MFYILKRREYMKDKNDRTKKIIFLCGAKKSYVRNALNLKALKKIANVIDFSSDAISYYRRLPLVLLRCIFCLQKYDLIFVGFLGQVLMPIVRLQTNKPIIFDAFISLYDTLCFDRKTFKPNSLIRKFAFWFDKKSCEWADIIITDTDAHANYFSKTFGIPKDKFQTIYLGADTDIFYPRNIQKNTNKFIVFYYGSGLPLQGIDVILKATKILEKDEKIIFQLVGPIRKKYAALINSLNLKNAEFIDWVPYEKLPDKIAQTDICLGGHFSDIDKAKRLISGKAYQFIAMKKPVILGDNPASKELFENIKSAIMVEMGNPDALAQAILELKEDRDLMEKISIEGYKIFHNKFLINEYHEEIFSKILNI